MANQDASAALLGSGASSITATADAYASASMLGSGSMTAVEDDHTAYSVHFSGSGDMTVTVHPYINVAVGDFSGSLTSVISSGIYHNTFASVYGVLTSTINATVQCWDVVNNMEPQKIISAFCKNKGESVAIQRYKGDSYPVTAKLSKDGNYNISGFTVRMSTQIGSGTVYTSTASITDAVNGEVEFILDPAAVGTSGTGTYDIEVNDGTYVYTYEKGTFTIVDDLTT